MKATIEAKALASAVSAVAPFVSKAGFPAITMIQVTATEVGLTLTAGDLEQFIQTDVAASVGEPGVALVPATTFAALASKLAGRVDLSLSDGVLNIEAPGRCFDVRCGDASTFPAIQWPDADPQPMGDAWQSALAVLYAASRDLKWPAYCGIHFHAEGRIEACDSFRASWAPGPPGLGVLVPASTISRVAKTLGSEVAMAVSANLASFSDDRTAVVTTLTQNPFPNVVAVIPDERPLRLDFDVAEMVDAVAAVAAIGDVGISNLIRVKPLDGVVELSRNTAEVGSAVATVEAEVRGTWPTFGINAAYFTDAIVATGEERAAIEAQDERKAMLILGGPCSHMVQPVNLQGHR